MSASPARVGLSAQLLNLSGTYRSAGISTFIYHLLTHLPLAAPDLEFHVLSNESDRHALSPQLQWHLTHSATRSPFIRILWEQFIQPWQVIANDFSLLHALAYVQPLLVTRPTCITVYDLSFLFYPYLFRPLNRWYLKLGTQLSVRRADRIIAISESTKQDIVQVFRVAPEKITVVPCGVDDEFFAEGKNTNHVLPFALPDKFVLYLGTLEPRKNIVRLIRAFAQAKQRAAIPHKLVLAGGRGWLYQEIDRAIEASGISDDIVLTGFVPAEAKAALYRAADAFVYPSLYEGFGLPPLEAMAAGTPVIASNASALPEVVGDAGLLVDPSDENMLSQAIVSMLTNSALREKLRQDGLERARTFTWRATAVATAQIYRDILANRQL